MTTPPKWLVGLTTCLCAVAFSIESAAFHHRVARAAMNEAKQATNPIRLAMLGWKIGEELETALKLDPNDLDVRVDLVRFYTVAPRLVGGSMDKAREQAAELAKRDVALGHFATGYIAYRDKSYGPARHELQDAVRTASTPKAKALALVWLGWLSQETQQWPAAFEAFEQLRATDAAGLYEIGRTSAFCGCELDRGKAALEQYIAGKRTSEMPSLAEARMQLGLVYEKRGERDAARREIETAWRLDRSLPGLKEARERLRM